MSTPRTSSARACGSSPPTCGRSWAARSPSWPRCSPRSDGSLRRHSPRPTFPPSNPPPGCSRPDGRRCANERPRRHHGDRRRRGRRGRLADGRAVFVPRTAPGERVRLRDGVRLHKTFARGELAEVVAPAPVSGPAGSARVTPPCPHYGRDRCGGCQLQHLAYDAQLAAKRAIVGEALRRIGKLDVADPEIVEAVEEWRYRAKISLAVKQVGRTDPKGLAVGRGRTVGLHPY